ncbi:hypothetical protein KZC52_14060 [Microbacterium sp. kSW2-24]|uniref:hypothetical protein n=1 Tax=Microbacterium galbinum TaxID=2851646 RepID=UPI001FFDCBB9|nr:hypothetical protein [Microbacterium galbinum]MCK2024059.1 hypothetical protein [Microbacterium galbinum]
MASRTYATPQDYARLAEEDWDGEATVLPKRLRSASIEVEKLTRRAVYDVDDDGYATDSDISEALTEATCAIAEYWVLTDDPTGADSNAGAVKIGSVSLGTTSSNNDNLTERQKLERRIGTRGIDILTTAGLIGAAVAHT